MTSRTMPIQAPRIRRLDADEARAKIPELAEVLIDCVEGGASVSFMLPIARDTALRFWQGVADERVLLVAEDAAGITIGTVQMITAQPENQPHRADIAKMLVHRRARRQGVGEALIQAVEAIASEEGKTVLVLDTVTGGAAERLYRRAGWQRVGDVPDFALMPDGAPCGTTFYYRHVAAS
ncbi:GNAT family N-acetyltransferase [Burkholderia gladioli]|uniref:GNAT family N-acetyltransferase n=1 Tax=Burkholderia gladioli TaxID=28095 RepID=UPI00164072B6|nr:GNAT family N-acetyltransferase [Burkholderia gladioli]